MSDWHKHKLLELKIKELMAPKVAYQDPWADFKDQRSEPTLNLTKKEQKLVPVFFYAQRKSDYYPPKTAQDTKKAKIPGELFVDKKDGYLIKVGGETSYVNGEITWIDVKELKEIAEQEKTSGWEPIKVTTTKGQNAIAFKYCKKVPDDAVKAESWPQTLTKDELPGGKGDTKKPSDFDPHEFEMGLEVESEHTGDHHIVAEIVADHLTEDPQYYTKLKRSGLADELNKKIFDINEDYDQLEKVQIDVRTGKWEPQPHDPPGTPHPENPNHVSGRSVQPGKKPVWVYRKDIADDFDKAGANLYPKFKAQMPQHAKTIDQMYARMSKEGDRHVIDSGLTEPEARMRHFVWAMQNKPGYSLTPTQTGFQLKAERHPKGRPASVHTWNWDGNKFKFSHESPISSLSQGDTNGNPKVGVVVKPVSKPKT